MKRGMDIVGSLLLLIVLSPVFFVIAAAIKLTSRGPVLFRQQRIGEHGTAFTFLKFRSMYVNNDASQHKEYVRKLIAGQADKQPTNGKGEGIFKLTNDPRITPVGNFLRRTSLDELPQFINVLRGDMSLVGPRPPVPYEVEAYATWHRRRLLEAKPGITGLWQVQGRSRVGFDDMVRLDLRYARNCSPWLDLKILVADSKSRDRRQRRLLVVPNSLLNPSPEVYVRWFFRNYSCLFFLASTQCTHQRWNLMIRFGVIGYGYWGPNIVRNLRALEGCQVVGICDQTPAARKRIQAANPGIPVHSDANELIQSPDVDAIAVITPVWTHYELTKAASESPSGSASANGKAQP